MQKRPKTKSRVHPLDLLSNEVELAKANYTSAVLQEGDVESVAGAVGDFDDEGEHIAHSLPMTAHINPRHLRKVKVCRST